MLLNTIQHPPASEFLIPVSCTLTPSFGGKLRFYNLKIFFMSIRLSGCSFFVTFCHYLSTKFSTLTVENAVENQHFAVKKTQTARKQKKVKKISKYLKFFSKKTCKRGKYIIQ